MSDEEFVLFADDYSGDLSKFHQRIFGIFQRSLPPLKAQLAVASPEAYETLLLGDEPATARLIHVLNRYPQGRTALAQWYPATIDASQSRRLFWTLSHQLCHLDFLNLEPTFRYALPPANAPDKQVTDGLLTDFAKCVPLKGATRTSLSTEFQALAQHDPDLAITLLPLPGRLMFRDNGPITSTEQTAILAVIANARDCDFTLLFPLNSADPTLVPKGSREPPADKPSYNVRVSKTLFQAAAKRPDFCGGRFFGEIARTDGPLAEILFKPFRRAADSTLRKDMIVELVNAGSTTGKQLLDDAFTGEAPRHAHFSNLTSYLDGSRAMATYKQLSTHDYLETGKRFPPIYKAGQPSADEIGAWTGFVQQYPWFPGTDDAYYRMAFAAYATGDPDRAVRTLQAYASRDMADQDAEPYMLELLGAIAFSDNANSVGSPNASTDLARLRAYQTLPEDLAAGRVADEASCHRVVNDLISVPWIAALLSNGLNDDALRHRKPIDMCRAYFRALGANDADRLVETLNDLHDQIAMHLALPPDDEEYSLSDAALTRLTALDTTLAEQARADESERGSLSLRTAAWLKFVKGLPIKCGEGRPAYCRAASAIGVESNGAGH